MSEKSTPNPVDIHVGQRLRQIRTLRGLTQEKLAQAIGITFQQVQKYERGTNRVGASRLYDLCNVLDVPVNTFFEGASDNLKPRAPAAMTALAEGPSATNFQADPFKDKETLDLVRVYYQIADPAMRRKVYEMAKLMAESGDAKSTRSSSQKTGTSS